MEIIMLRTCMYSTGTWYLSYAVPSELNRIQKGLSLDSTDWLANADESSHLIFPFTARDNLRKRG
jgi:hypothetical protein